MWLAFETATHQVSVAVGFPHRIAAEALVTGARQHAVALLPMTLAVLREAGTSLDEIEGIVVAEGPGSFTGLRVGAAAAKALVHTRGLPLWTAPSLMALAAGTGAEGTPILALADALRGELYAAAYRLSPGRVETLLVPTVLTREGLRERMPEPGVIVSTFGDDPVLPRASVLLGLVGLAGGARRIGDPGLWEPEYGRPAEAQARWEKAHGRPLPDSSRPAG